MNCRVYRAKERIYKFTNELCDGEECSVDKVFEDMDGYLTELVRAISEARIQMSSARSMGSCNTAKSNVTSNTSHSNDDIPW